MCKTTPPVPFDCTLQHKDPTSGAIPGFSAARNFRPPLHILTLFPKMNPLATGAQKLETKLRFFHRNGTGLKLNHKKLLLLVLGSPLQIVVRFLEHFRSAPLAVTLTLHDADKLQVAAHVKLS